MKSSERIIYSRIIFITGIVLLTSLSILFLYETSQKNSSSTGVYNTSLIRNALTMISSELNDSESDFRGYVLSLDSGYLKSSATYSSLETNLKLVDSLIAENTVQEKNITELKELVTSSVAQRKAVTQKLQDSAYTKSDLFVEDLKNESIKMDSIDALILKMKSIESALAKERELDAQKHTLVSTMMGVAVSIFSMIVFIIAFYFIDQELKRSQQYLNETKSLNTKVAEINTELSDANKSLYSLNAELEGKNFQLEKYAKELSSFTHIASHDMQEPLRKIEYFISIIEDDEKENLSEKGHKYLDKIKKSVSRMRKLFLGMLDFSLTNTIENKLEEVDLNDVLHQTLNSLKVYIKDTNTHIESDPLPKVKGIKYQLIQLFENIVSNAIKFRQPDVMPELRIRCKRIAEGEQTVSGLKNDTAYYKIDFKDNGIGFDPRYTEKIFEIFQRLTSQNDSYGVGIGLAISRKVAENHGGILLANSQPNEGSVFSFYIPVNQ